jgi:hypothetical protein
MLTTGEMRDQTWSFLFSWESQTYPTPSAHFRRLLPPAIMQAHGTGHHDLFGKGDRELTDRGKRIRQWPGQQLRQSLLLCLLPGGDCGASARGDTSAWAVEPRVCPSALVGVLINQRKRYDPQVRRVLSDNQSLRDQADYRAELVTATQAGRALRRSRLFVTAVRQRGGVAQ